MIIIIISIWINSIPIYANIPEISEPLRNISVIGNSITVTYHFPVFTKNTTPSDSVPIFHSIPGFGYYNEEGYPMLPVRLDTFKIPKGYKVSISCTTGNTQIEKCLYTGALIPKSENSTESANWSTISPYIGNFPSKVCSILQTYELRGEQLAEIKVCPIQYNYYEKKAYLYHDISYTLTFYSEDSNLLREYDKKDNNETINNSSITDLLNNAFVENANAVGGIDQLDTNGHEGSIGYLVITTDKYLDPVSNFIRWKKILGYTPYLLSKTSWGSSEDVMAAIRNYRELHHEIKYLIIIGDNNDVPAKLSYTHNILHLTDVYYGCTYTDQYIPDLYIGRIPISNLSEADKVIHKLIRTEMCPILNNDYYTKALHIAKFEPDQRVYYKVAEIQPFVQTSEEIRDYVRWQGVLPKRVYSKSSDADPKYYSYEYGFSNPLPTDLLEPKFKWDGTYQQAIDEINSGCLYALYRGHGSEFGWSGIKFNTTSLNQLNNYELYPTIFSITCSTGKFDNECFAVELLKLPNTGASSVIAASEESYSGFNDSFITGMIDAIWPEPGLYPRYSVPGVMENITPAPKPTYRLGQIIEQGLFRMKQQWWNTDTKNNLVRYQYEIYHLFGDPSMLFHTSYPESFTNVEISRTSNGIFVSTHGENASISFF